MSDHLYEGSASGFATARRGGLSGEQMREIEALRSLPRPTPWQALAERYGVCITDIKKVCEPAPAAPTAVNDDKPMMTWEERMRRQRLTRRATFWTEEKDRALKRMWVDQWMAASQCADILGVSVKSAEQRLKTLGINRSMRKRVA